MDIAKKEAQECYLYNLWSGDLEKIKGSIVRINDQWATFIEEKSPGPQRIFSCSPYPYVIKSSVIWTLKSDEDDKILNIFMGHFLDCLEKFNEAFERS